MDHVHFLIQSVPKIAPTRIANIVKSITAREIFKRCPEVKRKLWGGNFWSGRIFRKYSRKNGSERQIENYVKNQGKEYNRIFKDQIKLFE